jgi:hypothetical protein
MAYTIAKYSIFDGRVPFWAGILAFMAGSLLFPTFRTPHRQKNKLK